MAKDIKAAAQRLISKASTAYIGSFDAEGYPCIKAMMAPRKMMDVDTFYFSTNTSSQHVAQFRMNNRACLYFADTLFVKGVSLRGTMEVLTDTVSRELVWKKGDEKYYPQGVDDPDFCVLRFTATSLRYYARQQSEDVSLVEQA